MQKQFQPPAYASERLRRRQKMFAFFHSKKEWIKLNEAYVIGTATNFAVAIGTAHLARKTGVKESITSWLPVVNGFVMGVFALIASWYFLNIEKYQKDVEKIMRHTIEMLKI